MSRHHSREPLSKTIGSPVVRLPTRPMLSPLNVAAAVGSTAWCASSRLFTSVSSNSALVLDSELYDGEFKATMKCSRRQRCGSCVHRTDPAINVRSTLSGLLGGYARIALLFRSRRAVGTLVMSQSGIDA